jgi:predicted RND superfamily exporter protein
MKISSDSSVRFIIRNRMLILALTAISCCIMGFFATRVRVDNESMKSVPDTLKEKIALKELQKQFASPYILIYIAEFQGGTLLEKIDSLDRWAKRFEAIAG